MADEPRLSPSGLYLSFDGMTWPTAGDANGDLEWTLRYGEPTREQLLTAASVLAAYRQMVYDSAAKRQRVIHMLRKYGDPANMADTRGQVTSPAGQRVKAAGECPVQSVDDVTKWTGDGPVCRACGYDRALHAGQEVEPNGQDAA